MLEPSPTWTRIPRAVFPALYPFVWNRLGGPAPRLRAAQAEGLHPDATAAAPSPAKDTAEAVLLALADRYGRRETVEDAVATMPASQLNALRPVLEGTVPLDADAATEPYLRVMALVQPRLFADAASAAAAVRRGVGRRQT